jgi:hypothetical protein
MVKIKFVTDCGPDGWSKPQYKAGEIHTLRKDSAETWIKLRKAVRVEPEPAPEPIPEEPTPASKNGKKLGGKRDPIKAYASAQASFEQRFVSGDETLNLPDAQA